MDKNKIIKAYEKSAGYRVCYWCGKGITRGDRIIFLEEYEDKVPPHFIRTKVLGACCKKCFQKYKELLNKSEDKNGSIL